MKQNKKKEFEEKFADKEGCQEHSKFDKKCKFCQYWGGVDGEPKMRKRPMASCEDIWNWIEKWDEKLLQDYSDWLHKKGYIDSDYYTEEPKAVDQFLKSIKQ